VEEAEDKLSDSEKESDGDDGLMNDPIDDGPDEYQ